MGMYIAICLCAQISIYDHGFCFSHKKSYFDGSQDIKCFLDLHDVKIVEYVIILDDSMTYTHEG